MHAAITSGLLNFSAFLCAPKRSGRFNFFPPSTEAP
jgi:hypothetical protein